MGTTYMYILLSMGDILKLDFGFPLNYIFSSLRCHTRRAGWAWSDYGDFYRVYVFASIPRTFDIILATVNAKLPFM